MIRGVPLRLHYSVLLALPFFAWLAERRMQLPITVEMLSGVTPLASTSTWAAVLTAALIGSVLLHEGVHAAAARLAGGRVDGVTLVFFGGCGHAREIPSRGARLLVDAAAPIATLAVGALCYLAAERLPIVHLDSRYALYLAAEVQGIFGVIALLPAPPLDGGRLLAGLLERRLGGVRARAVVARAGQALAVVAALVGTVLPSLLLLAMAAVLWGGAERVLRVEESGSALAGVLVRDLVEPVPWIGGDEPVARLARRMLDEDALRFVVADEGRLSGVVVAGDVAKVDPRERGRTRVSELSRAVPAVDLEGTAAAARSIMRALGVDMLPVVDTTGAGLSAGGALTGMITRRAIADACAQGALRVRDLSVFEAADASTGPLDDDAQAGHAAPAALRSATPARTPIVDDDESCAPMPPLAPLPV